MAEQYKSLAEVKEMLLEANDNRRIDEENTLMNPFQANALSVAQNMTLSAEEEGNLIKELSELSLSTDGGKEYKMDDSVTYKIADLLPGSSTEVRAIMQKERVTLSKESMNAILDTVAKYRN